MRPLSGRSPFRSAMGPAGLGPHEFSSLREPSLGTGCLSRLCDLFAHRSESGGEIQVRSPPRPASQTGKALTAAQQGRADLIQASSQRRERQSVRLTSLCAADGPRTVCDSGGHQRSLRNGPEPANLKRDSTVQKGLSWRRVGWEDRFGQNPCTVSAIPSVVDPPGVAAGRIDAGAHA